MSETGNLPIPIRRTHRNIRHLNPLYNSLNPAASDLYDEILREDELTVAQDFEHNPYPSLEIPEDFAARELCHKLPILAEVHGDKAALQQLFKILNDLRMRGATDDQIAKQFNVTIPIVRKWQNQLRRIREREISTMPIMGVIADELDHLKKAREHLWSIVNSTEPNVSQQTKLKALSAMPRITYGIVGVLKETGYLGRRPYMITDDEGYAPATEARALSDFQSEVLEADIIDVQSE